MPRRHSAFADTVRFLRVAPLRVQPTRPAVEPVLAPTSTGGANKSALSKSSSAGRGNYAPQEASASSEVLPYAT